jgi:bifunctional non-homologous end joining protein LigD
MGGRHPGSARHATATSVVAGVRISHPERVLYTHPRATKLDVARYYESIGTWILPHVGGRPLTLVRCPEGAGGSCFYMRHSTAWGPPALRRVRIREKTKIGEYLIADDVAGIVSLVQMGVLEIHTWNSSCDEDVERPNRLVIDLDPGPDVEWARVVEGARIVRHALEALDLASFVKTTGGRGVHVVVPLLPRAGWADCLGFARGLCQALEGAEPGIFTTQYAKSERRGRILLDYLRNNRTNTSIAAYGTRARPGAPISMPIGWAELRVSLDPRRFTIDTVPARLARKRKDAWSEYWSCRQSLTAQRIRAVAGG